MLEVQLNELPRKLSPFDAVEQCYQEQLRFVCARLKEEVSVLIRCEKQVIPYLQSIIKRRLATDGKSITIIDGRENREAGPAGSAGTRLSRMVAQLRDLVNNTEANKVFFLPYLDIITSTMPGGLTMEAREIMTTIHENPSLSLVAFEDPDFALPELIAQAFPARCEMLGIARNRISSLITEIEARLARSISWAFSSMYRVSTRCVFATSWGFSRARPITTPRSKTCSAITCASYAIIPPVAVCRSQKSS